MSTITLDDIHAAVLRLSELIEAFVKTAKPVSQPTLLIAPEVRIALHPSEHYAGVVLNNAGQMKHHLILLADRPRKDLTWAEAMDWAKQVGGCLPDRQEHALIYANCKPHMKPEWHWSSEQHENASYAWFCGFDDGTQNYTYKSAEGAAVAVRRIAF